MASWVQGITAFQKAPSSASFWHILFDAKQRYFHRLSLILGKPDFNIRENRSLRETRDLWGQGISWFLIQVGVNSIYKNIPNWMRFRFYQFSRNIIYIEDNSNWTYYGAINHYHNTTLSKTILQLRGLKLYSLIFKDQHMSWGGFASGFNGLSSPVLPDPSGPVGQAWHIIFMAVEEGQEGHMSSFCLWHVFWHPPGQSKSHGWAQLLRSTNYSAKGVGIRSGE